MPVQTTPDRTPEGWGRVAAAYDTDIAPTMARYAEDVLDATGLRRGERVLDVAAGSGALAAAAARRGAQVTAIDFAPEMIERLLARGLGVDARVMDGQDLDFPDDSFDGAYSNMGLMFLPSPDAGMREMQRVVRPGGRIGIVTWAPPQRSEMFSAMFGALQDAVPDLPPPPEPPAAFSLSDPDDLARRMEEAGLRDVSVRQVVHAWTQESGPAMWEGLIRSNPVLPGILGKVDAGRVREAFLARVGRGPVALKGEAHVAAGTA